MTRCEECSQAAGLDVDHTPAFSLPPLLARFEHFLATKGILGEPQGAIDKDLPSSGHRVPSKEMSAKHRVSCLKALLPVLVEMTYLNKGDGAGRWVVPPHPNLRDLSVRQIQDYLARRFPRDPCRVHDDRCVRCCLPHHLSTYNKICEGFRKMAEWLYFEERFRDGPAWSKDKLVDVYAVTRRRLYKRGLHEINPVEKAVSFQRWLETEAVPVARRTPTKGRGRLYDRAKALYAETQDISSVAEELRLPYSTAYYWLTGRGGRRPRNERILAEMPRAYAYELWWLQETGSRYEEMAHAEFPLSGPFVTLNRQAGVLTIVGKGREGGKVRNVTLTKSQASKIDEILRWRQKLAGLLKEHTGRDPDPALFVRLADSRKHSGGRLPEDAGPWNTTLKAWAQRYNAWCKANGRDEDQLDVRLVMSHRIGRAVSISKLVKEGVAEKVVMLERGIEDHRTLEGYIHTTSQERREILERAERSRADRVIPAVDEEDGTSTLLEELRGLQLTVDELRKEVRAKDTRIGELTDRLLDRKVVVA